MPARFSILERHKTHDQLFTKTAMALSGAYASRGFPVAANDVDLLTGIQTVLVENQVMWTGTYGGVHGTWLCPVDWDADNGTIRLFGAPAGGGPLSEAEVGYNVTGVTINLLAFAG